MIGTRLLDRYELMGELGKGGMAVVYRAKDPRLGREVAVKMISTDGLVESAVERFQREAQVVAGLDHPAIAPIYDFGRHETWLFFVMPVLQGRTLHQLLRDRRLPLDETLEIIAQVAEALDYSSSNQVVHRDIKPENIMVSLDRGKVARVWVMDFGLALPRTSSRLTKTGNLPGTLSYLSPEQVLSADIDGRSDLYSLGTILYECLSGQPPFEGSPATVLYRIVHEKPAGLAAQGVDPRLEALVLSCMAKYPEERIDRGQDLAVALREYLRELRQHDDEERRLPRIGRRAERPGEMPLVGRMAELAELKLRLEAAVTGECQLVLLSGERGMGKSRLLRELENEARLRRIRVLHGRFSTREGGYAYEAFGELIQDYFRRLHAAGSTGSHVALPKAPDFSDVASELLALFPALGEIPELCGAALDDSRGSDKLELEDPNHLYELIARTMTRMSGAEPLILMVEQLHAADASIRLIQYLFRRLGPTPTLILGTYRPSAIGKRHPLKPMVQGLEGDQAALHLELKALDRGAHRELLEFLIPGPSLTDELAERLYEATEGNPFFVQELVRTLTDSGELDAKKLADRWDLLEDSRLSGEMPETIQQAVETRLERLADHLQRILGTASVLGRRFEFRDLEHLWDGADDLEDGIDALISRELLEEDRRARGDWLRFSSALVREVIYARLPRRRRRRLHRRHAENLEGRYGERPERVLSQLVHHFSEGDVVDKTIHYGRMLARQSLDAYCWDDAIRAAEVVLDFAEDEPTADPVEGDLRLILAEAQSARGRADAAVKEAGRAVKAFERAQELDKAAQATLLLAETAWKSRRLGEMQKWLDEGLILARQGGSDENLASLLTLAATSANLRGSYGEANQYLQEARALAGKSDAEPVSVEPEAEAELRIGMLADLTTTDPALALQRPDVEVLSQVFEPLLQVDSDGNYIPRLCRALSSSEDGTVYTFQLRRDLRFSDGTVVDASLVKKSLEEAARRGARRTSAVLELLQGGKAWVSEQAETLDGLKVTGELDLEMTLIEPQNIFPALLSSHTLAVALRTNNEVLGTGPFCLRRGERGWLLEPNPHSRIRDTVKPSRLELRVFPDSRRLADALRANELEIARDLMPVDLEDFFRNGRFRNCVRETTLPSIAFVLFNARGPRSHERGLRRILTGVIDSRELVWRRMARFALPAMSWIPPGLPGHDAEPQRPRPVDRIDAIASMQEFTPLPVRLKVAMDPIFADRYRSVTEAIFSEWSLLGVDIEVEKTAPTANRDWSGFDLIFSRWLPDYFDPDAFCFGSFHSSVGELADLVASDELDRLIEQARGETRVAVRERLYRRLQRLLVHEHLVLPLFHDVDYRVHSPRVDGLRTSPRPPFVDYRGVGWLPESAVRRTRPGANRSGRLHIPLPARFETLDPIECFISDCAEVVSTVFETLTCIDEGAAIAPHLAESITADDEAREFRVRLREVRFHDGRRLNPRDVRYSFCRLLRSGRSEAEATLLHIEGALAYQVGQVDELEGVVILSDRELLIRLAHPLAYFPALLSDPSTAIVPEGATRFDGTWRDGCVGTGPFCLVGLEPGTRVELAANPDYWRSELPRCERLVFELGVSPNRLPQDFESDRFQVVGHMSPADLEHFSHQPAYAANLREHPAFATHFLAFNRLQGPLADPVVRTALDRRIRLTVALSLVKLGRMGVPAAGFIPPGLLIREPVPPPSDSIGGERFDGLRLEVALHPQFLDQFSHFWQALSDDLTRSGAELVVRHTNTAEMLEAAARRTVDVVATRWIADAPDPSSFADVFHSDDGILGRMLCHERLDRLIDQGRRETDIDVRQGLYRELERILGQEALVVPLFHEQVCWLAQPGVEGLRVRYGWPEVAYEELWLSR